AGAKRSRARFGRAWRRTTPRPRSTVFSRRSGRSHGAGSKSPTSRPRTGLTRRPAAGLASPARCTRSCNTDAMVKLIVEIVLAIFLHPIAFVLCVIDIVNRQELSGLSKLLWIIVTFFWGIGPILYILLGRGKFW